MPKNTQKSGGQSTAVIAHDDPLQIGRIIDAIEMSALPEIRKMAYLYIIADGAFSYEHLEKLQAEMIEAGKLLRKDKAFLEQEIAALEEEVSGVEHNIAKLVPKAAEELMYGSEKIVRAAEKKTNEEQKKAEITIIKKTRRKLPF